MRYLLLARRPGEHSIEVSEWPSVTDAERAMRGYPAGTAFRVDVWAAQ